MKPNKTDLEYLEGKKFSSGYCFNINFPVILERNRVDLLVNLCSGKKIIHFGCADHIPLIKEKIKDGQHLHSRLEDNASKLIGLDSDRKAVDYLKKNCGFNDVYKFDLFSNEIPTEIDNMKFDYIILGEVLEHVDNPVSFLAEMNKKFSKIVPQIIVTVPNIASIIRLRQIAKNYECINTDHRYWFTPYTLSKVVLRAGMNLTKIHGTDTHFPNKFSKWAFKLGLWRPRLKECDTLVAVANLGY
jgi:2-polyprenyl-3-methyl-5-hydroxy-6-metoxy-1,4-benzoquinol methylase